MGRIIRIATLAENDPVAIDLGGRTPGKILIRNAGSNDIFVGYDRSDVLASTASNYFTVEAGITYVFDISPQVGYVNQFSQMWMAAQGGSSSLEVWVTSGN
tara:strand:- start:4800 stop:5102 length:303 start_codon:yes stop_codon:yes gene_type:complete